MEPPSTSTSSVVAAPAAFPPGAEPSAAIEVPVPIQTVPGGSGAGLASAECLPSSSSPRCETAHHSSQAEVQRGG